MTKKKMMMINLTSLLNRPELVFREDWKEIPAELPVTQEHVANENLVLHLYGPGKDGIKKSHHDHIKNDPFYIWSGKCTDIWALTLSHKSVYADLTGVAKIRWQTRQSGEHYLRVLLKLADGVWLISDDTDGPSPPSWHEKEFCIAEMTWHVVDMNTFERLSPVVDPDLSRVEEIGFTDLKTGSGSQHCSRLNWIEVWGRSVPRSL